MKFLHVNILFKLFVLWILFPDGAGRRLALEGYMLPFPVWIGHCADLDVNFIIFPNNLSKLYMIAFWVWQHAVKLAGWSYKRVISTARNKEHISKMKDEFHTLRHCRLGGNISRSWIVTVEERRRPNRKTDDLNGPAPGNFSQPGSRLTVFFPHYCVFATSGEAKPQPKIKS